MNTFCLVSAHVMAEGGTVLKTDGTVEGGTGFVPRPSVWACRCTCTPCATGRNPAANAFFNGGRGEMRNTLVHVRNVRLRHQRVVALRLPRSAVVPTNPFGAMKVAVTGVLCGEDGDLMWTEELVAREQALAALATNCARQMFVEDERESIADGKYADFLLVDRTC